MKKNSNLKSKTNVENNINLAKYFYFGEVVEGYNQRVLNEREVRAAAGIFFFFSMIVFFNGFILGNFIPLKIFVMVFLLDFSIRIFVNPKYSPTMIIAKFIVSNQTPEYVGAAQKKFAWIIGLIIAIIMFYLSIISNIGFTPLTCILCVLCLIFLLFESAFGICIGCYIYGLFNKDKPDMLCAGDVCKIKQKEEIQKINFFQILIVVLFLFLFILLSLKMINSENNYNNINTSNSVFTSSKQDCILTKENNENNTNSNLFFKNNSDKTNIFGGDCLFH